MKWRVALRVSGTERPERVAGVLQSAINGKLGGHACDVVADAPGSFDKNRAGEKVVYLDLDLFRVGACPFKLNPEIAHAGKLVSIIEYKNQKGGCKC